MQCVNEPCTVEELIKKSRFIAVIAPCEDESAVMAMLKQLHAAHPNATHIAYAYRLKTVNGIIYRFHDAGEPTGTAGKPIFQHIEGKELINVLVAVIRYFGGVKLGAGGLTRAYGHAAKLAIETAALSPYVELVTVALTLDYSQLQPLEYLLKKLAGHIVQQDFTAQVHVQVSLPAESVPVLLHSFPT